MKTTVDLTIALDPVLTKNVDLFAYNMAKNIEMCFNVKVAYNVIPSGNTYRVDTESKNLSMDISEFIETNWKL